MFARLNSLAIKLLVGLIVLHLMITGLGRPAEAATRTTVDGVTHVRNDDQPRDGRRTVTLRERWRIGGDDEETLFGRIPRVAAGPDGNVYVLDSQLCEVSVYDRDGALLRTLFREGEGPGEVREPRDMFVLGDGRVGLIQDFPGVAVMVDGQGNPAGRITVGGTEGGIHSLTACQGRGDVLLLAGTHHDNSRPGFSGRDFFLERYSPAGELLLTENTVDGGDDGQTVLADRAAERQGV